ncbi:MAG: T9SS type A sorting domain-containing protein [Bacteroidetes bacterium]|nr:MAG: T9SS type A sorting domain-containing protein [Bacteroidota bacterium]
MKRIAGIFLLFLPLIGAAQAPHGEIGVNGIRWGLNNRGILFQNNGQAAFEAPIDSGIHAILASGIWIAGKDQMGNLYVSAACYDTSGQDFFPGPIDKTTYIAADTANWNHLWITDSAAIAGHQSWYNNQGYQAPWSIANWPGSYSGSANFNPILAPFVDYNANNKYEPDSGEIPYIRGKSAAYFILNDVYGTHTQSNGNGLGMEVYGMVHVDQEDPNYYVVYANYRFVNRSNRTYDSLYIGVFTDFLLGKKDDNYISTDSNRNLIYAYNAEAYDSMGYKDNPAVVGMQFLSEPLGKSISFDWGAGDEGWPQTPREYFQYLAGRYRNEMPIQDPLTSQNSYIYAGNPCTNTGWTEYGSVNSVPGRRSALGSIGPKTVAPGGYVRLDVAYIFNRNGTDYIDNVCKNLAQADAVQNYWNKNLSSAATPQTQALQIYPNPAKTVIYMNQENLVQVQLIDMKGSVAKSYKRNPGSITVSDLKPGIYLVMARDAQGNHYRTKLVITP